MMHSFYIYVQEAEPIIHPRGIGWISGGWFILFNFTHLPNIWRISSLVILDPSENFPNHFVSIHYNSKEVMEFSQFPSIFIEGLRLWKFQIMALTIQCNIMNEIFIWIYINIYINIRNNRNIFMAQKIKLNILGSSKWICRLPGSICWIFY